MPTDSDDEALFAALENEEDPSYRDTRIQQLNAEFASSKTNRSTDTTNHLAGTNSSATLTHSSTYPTLQSDQSVLDHTTSTTRSLIHFYHPDFARCALMDKTLTLLAGVHHEVRFARVDVRNTPFLVEKLGIRVLPCVIGFKDGVGVERVVGFEGLGERGFDGTDSGFSVGVFERRMVVKGVFVGVKVGDENGIDGGGDDSGDESEDERRNRGRNGGRKSIRSGKIRRDEEEDDDDWD
jgi:thiol-disulfide isomerase/thioredoxin